MNTNLSARLEPDGRVRLTGPCAVTGKEYSVVVTLEGVVAYFTLGAHIAEAFPELPRDEGSSSFPEHRPRVGPGFLVAQQAVRARRAHPECGDRVSAPSPDWVVFKRKVSRYTAQNQRITSE